MKKTDKELHHLLTHTSAKDLQKLIAAANKELADPKKKAKSARPKKDAPRKKTRS